VREGQVFEIANQDFADLKKRSRKKIVNLKGDFSSDGKTITVAE
jgi:hypothetical protein